MAVRVETQEIPKALDGNDGAGNAFSSGTMVCKNTFRESPPGRRPYGLEAMHIGSA
jgi:hypothetical protein